MSDPFISTFPLKELIIDGTLVCYEDSIEPLLAFFSKSKAEEFVHLLHEAQIHPKKAYREALLWKETYPLNPPLDNLLAFLHLQNNEKIKAETLISESYKNYPDYFFAKINYADQCLRKKKLKEIPSIFPSFDLSTLFPQKKCFHVSEFRGFMILLCRYYYRMKNKELTKKTYQNAYLADPSHLSLIQLEKEIFPQKIFYKCWILFLKFFKLCYAPFRKEKAKGIPN